MISILECNRYGQVKPMIIILIFAARYTVLRSKSKDWLVWNEDNVS
jgi:hypothetical protein